MYIHCVERYLGVEREEVWREEFGPGAYKVMKQQRSLIVFFYF